MALTKSITIGETSYDFPTKTSELTNDAGFITEGESGLTIINLKKATTEEKVALYTDIAAGNVHKYKVVGSLTDYDSGTYFELMYIGKYDGGGYAFSVTQYTTQTQYINLLYSNGTIGYKSITEVYNSTITINQGTTKKGYFSVNQSSDKTITLDAVPTKVSDLENDMATETWTFTLEDGTTVNKTIFIKE